MECVPVFHCQQAYGVVLHYDSVYYQKITYSGDTKPCPLFVEKSMGANLMIHEATFYDDFESIESMSHSTLTQAITAGYTSGAERLLLTHFSNFIYPIFYNIIILKQVRGIKKLICMLLWMVMILIFMTI